MRCPKVFLLVFQRARRSPGLSGGHSSLTGPPPSRRSHCLVPPHGGQVFNIRMLLCGEGGTVGTGPKWPVRRAMLLHRCPRGAVTACRPGRGASGDTSPPASSPGRVDVRCGGACCHSTESPKGQWEGLQLRHWHRIGTAKGDMPGRRGTGGTCGWVFQPQDSGRQRSIHRKQSSGGGGQPPPAPSPLRAQRPSLMMSLFILRVFYPHNVDGILHLSFLKDELYEHYFTQ